MDRVLNPIVIDPLVLGTIQASGAAGIIFKNSSGNTIFTAVAGPGTATAFNAVSCTTLTASGIVQSSYFKLVSTTPEWDFIESDAVADQKNWINLVSSSIYRFRCYSDDLSANADIFTITRSGYTPSLFAISPSVVIGATTLVGSERLLISGGGALPAVSTTQVAISAGGIACGAGVSCTALTASGLTSTRVPFAGTGGLLGDSALFTFASGTITLGDNTSAGGVLFNGAAGSVRSINVVQSAGVARWGVFVRDATDDYRIRAYDDAGSAIDYPLTIARAAGGAITLTRPLVGTSFTTASTADGAITTAGKISAKVAVPASFADLAAVQSYLASIIVPA